MKKLITALLLCASIGYAEDGIYRASTTFSNDLALIQPSTNTVPQVLEAVVVGSASLGGLLTIYNSTFGATTMSTITYINLTNTGFYDFKGIRVKGIYYRTTGNSNGITIIYKY